MKLTNAEIRALATDELRDYISYLKRVNSHQRGATGEMKRCQAELDRRPKPVASKTEEELFWEEVERGHQEAEADYKRYQEEFARKQGFRNSEEFGEECKRVVREAVAAARAKNGRVNPA